MIMVNFYCYYHFVFSDETADMAEECRRRATDSGAEKVTTISMLSTSRSIAAFNRWRIKGDKGSKRDGTGAQLSCDSQQPDSPNEITYVPTSALKSAMAADQKNGSGRRASQKDETFTEYDEGEKVSIITA